MMIKGEIIKKNPTNKHPVQRKAKLRLCPLVPETRGTHCRFRGPGARAPEKTHQRAASRSTQCGSAPWLGHCWGDTIPDFYKKHSHFQGRVLLKREGC